MTFMDVRSARNGVAWPSLPDEFGMVMLALQYQFDKAERWSVADLRALQVQQLSSLLEHAYECVPFYRRRLGEAGYRQGAAIDAEVWQRIPVLRRQDIQASGPALRASRVPEAHGRISTTKTSGSTGMPVEVVATELTATLWEAVTLRDALWHRRDLGGTMAVLRGPHHAQPRRDGLAGQAWNTGIGAAFANGRSVMHSSTLPAADQIEWLARQDADYLLCHPSVLRELCAESVRRRVQFPKLKSVLTFGEAFPPNLRAIVHGAWHLPIEDNYSASEIGYLALQCPESEQYHVQAETMLVEILDEAGTPTPPGAIGRVVVTPLHNFAMPLLRYEIGDYAEVGGGCACGRTLPVLTRIVGRARNILHHADGRRTWPFIGWISAHAKAPIVQFQIVQRRIDLLEAKLAVARAPTAAEEAQLRDLVAEACGHEFALELSYHAAIPRSPSGKFEDFISDLASIH